DIDIALFTGGEDVDPSLYGQNVGNNTFINVKRDSQEKSLYHILHPKTLKLGICRGSQFLTVMSGGSLIQHVEGHGGNHLITVVDTHPLDKEEIDIFRVDPDRFMTMEITSTHHQMM